MKGFKRLFGLDGLMNFVKGIAKIVMVGGACVWAIWPELDRLESALDLSPSGVVAWRLALIFKAVLAALAVIAVIAVLDYVYQRQRFMAAQPHEPAGDQGRDKQTEGDPRSRPGSGRSAWSGRASA